MISAHRLLALAIFLLSISQPSRAASPVVDYEQRLSLSLSAEERGDLPDARALMDDLVRDYPQDCPVHVRVGWLEFSLKSYSRAHQAYAQARAICPSSPDAALGLGWSEYYRGNEEEARAWFNQTLALRPGDASAREGLALLEQSHLRLGVKVELGGTSFSNNPAKETVWTAGLGIPVQWKNWSLELAWQGLHFTEIESRGFFGGGRRPGQITSPRVPSYNQHEGYLALGWGTDFFGLRLIGAVLDNGNFDEFSGELAGVTLRISPWGHILGELSFAQFQEVTAWRGQVAWLMPLTSRLKLRPAIAGQRVDGESFYSLRLAGILDLQPVEVSLGAETGTEFMPAYLDVLSVENTPERYLWGAWAQLEVALSKELKTGATWRYRSSHMTGISQDGYQNTIVGFVELGFGL